MNKPPDKKQARLTYEEFCDDTWLSLIDALQKPGVSVAVLTSYIEKNGVKTFDQVGRLIVATDGEEQESTSKAHALNMLAIYYAEIRDCDDLQPGELPGEDPNRWLEWGSPLSKFGWPKDELPDDLDDFAKWIANSLLESGISSSAAIKDTNLKDSKEQAIQIPDTSLAADIKTDSDKIRSDLFDPVPVEALEKMFPADGKWKGWAEHAKRNGLIETRKERRMFNPYEAAVWFVSKGINGWDLARCYRVLGNNLPARSHDEKHLFSSEPN